MEIYRTGLHVLESLKKALQSVLDVIGVEITLSFDLLICI